MSSPIVSVENLSKRYLVGHSAARVERYTALRDVMARHARNFVRKTRDMWRGNQIIQGDEIEEFWALRDVTFDVQPGEVLGIIGRNGAGKSTLLKVLSRITEPTLGRVTLRGRVASLLEVGTGFHPELTGRENIFLNGAVLGMDRAEIRRKFDEIVAFAEIEKFLDTPVKRYSSGMYVRLAFAVAAHLEPEILIVDEVLAVGDAAFQRKCLGKIRSVTSLDGRTVIFVSHNLQMVTALCGRCLLVREGHVAYDGTPAAAVLAYQNGDGHESTALRDYRQSGVPPGDDYYRLLDVRLMDSDGRLTSDFRLSDEIHVKIDFEAIAPRNGHFKTYPQVSLQLPTGEFVLTSMPPNGALPYYHPGIYTATCTIDAYLLNTGIYELNVGMATCDRGIHVHFHEERMLSISVSEDMYVEIERSRNGYSGTIPGMVRPRLKWKLDAQSVCQVS